MPAIGVGAPALLLFARLLQGLSLGGEYGASATYLSEMATRERRGFYSSFQYVTLIGGQLIALVVLLVLQNFVLTAEQLRAFGWRIPFVIGAVLALFALIMRRDLARDRRFRGRARRRARTDRARRACSQHPREALIVIGLTMGGTLAFYVYTTYMQKFLKLSVGLSDDQTTWVSAGSLVFAMMLQPLYGAISDRIGRRPLLLGFGVLGHARHRAAAHRHPARGGPVASFGADRHRLADRLRLHLDQRRGEGRAVPRRGPRHRRRPALCHRGFAVRRLGRICRAVVQERGRRERLLLVRHRRHLLLAAVYFLMRDTQRTSRIDAEGERGHEACGAAAARNENYNDFSAISRPSLRRRRASSAGTRVTDRHTP